MDYVISKGTVKAWLRKLIKQGILVAPGKLNGNDVIFKESFTPQNILLEYKQPLYSVKSYLLPQEETMFTFQDRSMASLEAVYDQFPRIFFGLRPCDLRAITIADRFFNENFQDPYYNQRRQQTLLIALGCNNPEPHCFCGQMGLGPFYSEGADIFMADLGSLFLVTPQSAKGIKAVEQNAYFFEQATATEKAEKSLKKKEANEILKQNLWLEKTWSKFSAITDRFWAEISQHCFSCGSCSYICPLCFCYNVVDRENKDMAGKRVRTWDSCIFEGFTRMAGRHNLLKSRQERLQKRFAHKLQQYPEQYGIPGCSGCGRCSVSCPGHIGMAEVIKKMAGEASGDE